MTVRKAKSRGQYSRKEKQVEDFAFRRPEQGMFLFVENEVWRVSSVCGTKSVQHVPRTDSITKSGPQPEIADGGRMAFLENLS